jgi:hypothetical protein
VRSRSPRDWSSLGEQWLPVLVIAGAVPACGPSLPREQDIYHHASLRPGAVPAQGDAERELLERLPSLAVNEPVRLGDHTFVPLPAYASASGRTCTPVRVSGGGHELTRVACEQDGAWTFVPDIFDGGEDPFASEGSP